jgi:hypothetical protein
MAIKYYLPEAVRLQYARAGVAVDTYTRGVQAQWRRSFEFLDLGYSTGLVIFFGSQSGQLVATDLQLATSYNHNFATHGALPASTLWLPSTLTPIDGSDLLVTTNIALYFDALGGGGTALTTFKCLARPEQIDPQLLQEGLAAAQVAYRWEIRDDAQPDITP